MDHRVVTLGAEPDLASLVAFKRLAGRLRDRADLEALEEIHGELPVLRIPSLDEPA